MPAVNKSSCFVSLVYVATFYASRHNFPTFSTGLFALIKRRGKITSGKKISSKENRHLPVLLSSHETVKIERNGRLVVDRLRLDLLWTFRRGFTLRGSM